MKLYDQLKENCRAAHDAEFARVLDTYKNTRLKRVMWWIGMHIGGAYCYSAAFDASVRAATAAQVKFGEAIAAFREEQGLPA